MKVEVDVLGLPVPNSPYGLGRRKANSELELKHQLLQSGSTTLISERVSEWASGRIEHTASPVGVPVPTLTCRWNTESRMMWRLFARRSFSCPKIAALAIQIVCCLLASATCAYASGYCKYAGQW